MTVQNGLEFLQQMIYINHDNNHSEIGHLVEVHHENNCEGYYTMKHRVNREIKALLQDKDR